MRCFAKLFALTGFLTISAPSSLLAAGAPCFSPLQLSDAGNTVIHESANWHRDVRIVTTDFNLVNNASFAAESPTRSVATDEFWIDAHEVTNRQFSAFVAATGYITTAERAPDPQDYPGVADSLLVPGSASFIKLEDRPAGQWREWWKFIKGANWREPEGAGSSIDRREDYPVIHVSYVDALAYADWVGRALPTEAQWELAAQASINIDRANTWQGFFPLQDKALDGYDGIAPVGCYSPDAYGLFDMKGNVSEMVSDIYLPKAGSELSASIAPVRVIKGSSFLCAENYCDHPDPHARQGQEQDFSTDHVGFRTVARSAIETAH